MRTHACPCGGDYRTMRRSVAALAAMPSRSASPSFPAHVTTDVLVDIAETNRALRVCDGNVIDTFGEGLLLACVACAS
jgi:hypothetical protein